MIVNFLDDVINRETDERLCIARMALDDCPDRANALKLLRPHHFTLRYLDWYSAIAALHTDMAPISTVALIADVASRGVIDPSEEFRLCLAEISDTAEGYEPLAAIAQRVITNSRRRWFVSLMQGALQEGQQGQLPEFDDAIRTARRLVHEISTGAHRPAAVPKTVALSGNSRAERRRKFTTTVRQ